MPLTPAMKAVLIPLAIIAIGLFLLVKYSGLKVWHMVIVLITGLYLASTPFGQQITTWISHMLASFGH